MVTRAKVKTKTNSQLIGGLAAGQVTLAHQPGSNIGV
jgi:hypothetical protein